MTSAGLILDLFAGPRGWSQGLRMLGLSDVGVEVDEAACRTAGAAGHLTIRADVATFPLKAGYQPWGIIASPPCQDFSSAGLMVGQGGTRGQLVTEPLRYTLALKPEWTVWEQVPLVLPIWRRLAFLLRQAGYSVWSGVVDAADYGVPQNRQRALLIADRRSTPFPPTPTHGETTETLWGSLLPWVTLADHLGLESGWVYDSGQNSTMGGGRIERYVRSCDRPAGTVTGKTTSQWVLRKGDQRRKLSEFEAATLQTFPADYPFQGKREQRLQQIGDAVPPLLAAHVLSSVTGVALHEQVAA